MRPPSMAALAIRVSSAAAFLFYSRITTVFARLNVAATRTPVLVYWRPLL